MSCTSSLAMKPADITIWKIYQSVDRDSLETLIGLHPNPNQKCLVGENIYYLLEEPYSKIKGSVRKTMEDSTLQQIIDAYTRKTLS